MKLQQELTAKHEAEDADSQASYEAEMGSQDYKQYPNNLNTEEF